MPPDDILYQTCPECNGTGKEHLGEEDCHTCEGSGKILREYEPENSVEQ